MPSFDLIALDADDTLWHTQPLYEAQLRRFADLLAPYTETGELAQQLYATEMRNLAYFGYGVKSFTLSMIETAIDVTQGRVSAEIIGRIVASAREMIDAPVEPLPGVEDAVAALAASRPLMVLTKGDLLDQERKLARSGLAQHFTHVEVVSHKTPEAYAALLAAYGIEPARFLMVGNSLKSDVLPVLEVGGWGVHVPYHITWAHEAIEPTAAQAAQYIELESLAQLPGWVERASRRES